MTTQKPVVIFAARVNRRSNLARGFARAETRNHAETRAPEGKVRDEAFANGDFPAIEVRTLQASASAPTRGSGHRATGDSARSPIRLPVKSRGNRAFRPPRGQSAAWSSAIGFFLKRGNRSATGASNAPVRPVDCRGQRASARRLGHVVVRPHASEWTGWISQLRRLVAAR